MIVEDCTVMIDVASKFFWTSYLSGWFRRNEDRLHSVELVARNVRSIRHEVTLSYPGLEEQGCQGWQIQCLFEKEGFPTEAVIVFNTEAGAKFTCEIAALVREREEMNPSLLLDRHFFDRLNTGEYPRVLDVGGRDRSLIGKSPFGTGQTVTVLDIVKQEGVDVVGDAHELSRLFAPNSFDAIHCRSVLEHIAMPWKLVVEAAIVLRTGGMALFHTHQTVGMHDLPWDFWRFSAFAWDALFNRYTGFRVVEHAMAQECFVIPFRWRPGVEFEKAAGFEVSSVLVEKIGPPSVQWPVPLEQILSSQYPTTGAA